MSLELTFGVVDQIDISAYMVTAQRGGAALDDLPEDPALEWSATAPSGTYPTGTVVWRALTHKTYTRIATIHDTVEATPPENAADKWKEGLPTNVWCAFDIYAYTAMQANDALQLVLRPQVPIDTVDLEGLIAASATITVTEGVGGPEVGSITSSLDGEGRYDWQTFFIAPVIKRDALLLLLDDLVADPVITITLTNAGSPARLGNAILGRRVMFGRTDYDSDIGRISYSRFEEGTDGRVKIVKRPGAGDINARVEVEPDMAATVDYLLSQYDASPTLWIAHTLDSPWVRPLRKYGIFDGRLSYPDPSRCLLTGRIKGMV